MAYGAALERRFSGNAIEGSNPSPSARFMLTQDLAGILAMPNTYNKFLWRPSQNRPKQTK